MKKKSIRRRIADRLRGPIGYTGEKGEKGDQGGRVSDGPQIRIVGPGCGHSSFLFCEQCDWEYEVLRHAPVWEVWEVAASHWNTNHVASSRGD